MTTSLPQIPGHNLLTNSRLSCRRRCARQHLYRYEMGIRKNGDAKPLRLGGAVHKGLEALAQYGPGLDFVSTATQCYEELPDWANTDEGVQAWLIERETVARMLAGYHWYWSQQTEPTVTVAEYVAVELAFELPIRNPDTGKATNAFKVGGKIDAIVKLNDGRMAVMEHKTTSDDIDAGAVYWQRLTIDDQISLYYVAARELGYDVQTVLYDVLAKPTIRPKAVPILDPAGMKIVVSNAMLGSLPSCQPLDMKTALRCRVENKNGTPKQTPADDSQFTWTRLETPAEWGERFAADIVADPTRYFARRDIPRLESDLDEFKRSLWDTQQEIRQSQLKGWHQRNTNACVQYSTPCEYLSLCHNGIDPNNIPSGFARVETLHPELQGEAE